MTTTAAVEDREIRVQKRRLSSLVVAHVANDAYFGFLPPILPLLVIQMNLSNTLAVMLASTFALTGAVGQPLFGYLTDRVRKGWLVALGPIVGGFMTLLIYMPNYPAMLLLLLFAGTGSACFHPVASVIAAQISGKRKGLGVSIYVSGGRLGVGIGAAAATFIATNWGLEAIPIAGAIGVVIGLPFLFIAPPIEGEAASHVMNLRETLSSLRTVGGPLIVMWLVNLCRTILTMSVGTLMPLYIVQGGGTVGAGGRAVTLFLFAAAVGGILGGHVSDRMGRRGVMMFGLMAGTPILGFSFLFDGIPQLALLMLSGSTLYAPMGVSVTYAQEVAPEHRALVSSFMLGVVWFFGSSLMLVVGALSDLFGLVTVLPLTCIIIGGVGAFLTLWLPKLPSK